MIQPPQWLLLVSPADVLDVAGQKTGSRQIAPDLQFDHVVYAAPRIMCGPEEVGVSEAALASGHVWFIGEPGDDKPVTTAPGWQVGFAMAEASFPELDVAPMRSRFERRTKHTGAIEELRTEHYNASITYFEPTHSDLWVLRVRPDNGDTSYLPGQYASLGLGF